MSLELYDQVMNAHRAVTRPRLYLDLDGVLADFDRGYIERFGKHPREVEDAELWQNLNATPDFFDTLHPMPDALQAFAWLGHLGPTILTACPRTNYHDAAANKRRWVRRHLGPDVTVLPCMGGTNKPVFMHAAGDVLVDDFEKNVRAWRAAGGVGILHRGDWAETLEALSVIFLPGIVGTTCNL